MDNFQGCSTGAGMSAKNKNCANLFSDICSPWLFCLHIFHLSRSAYTGERKMRGMNHHLNIQSLWIPYGKSESTASCWWWHAKTIACSMNTYIYLFSLPVHTFISYLMLDGKLFRQSLPFCCAPVWQPKQGSPGSESVSCAKRQHELKCLCVKRTFVRSLSTWGKAA